MEAAPLATHFAPSVLIFLSTETRLLDVPLRKKLHLKPTSKLQLDGKIAIKMVTPATRTHFFIKYRISKERTALWNRKTEMSVATHLV